MSLPVNVGRYPKVTAERIALCNFSCLLCFSWTMQYVTSAIYNNALSRYSASKACFGLISSGLMSSSAPTTGWHSGAENRSS